MSQNQISPQIIKVQDLLAEEKLTIPDFQRPYKWTVKNVNQLIDDILNHQNKSAYRLGTIVFFEDTKNHNYSENLNIVDGQQRTITILLIDHAIKNNQGNLMKEMKEQKITAKDSKLINSLCFDNPISKINIQNNYREIYRRVNEFNVDSVNFFYEKCEFVKVVLQDISEAFQFFDSQNSRGKDLEPHDLLKAFHLREMAEGTTEQERIKVVENWENQNTNDLKHIFGNYLFRIRNWAKGESARYFTKNEVDLFKGISPSFSESFPFSDLYKIGHYYIESYNQEIIRNIDRNQLNFPFQIDQVIINGKRFFEMVEHYSNKINNIQTFLNTFKDTQDLFTILDNYEGKNRIGDRYIRNLFNCCLIYYFDKFGEVALDRAVEKFFVWAYSLRLSMHSVQLASVDNYALREPCIFNSIKQANQPKEILNINLGVLVEIKSTKTTEIENHFKKLKYFNGNSN